MKYIELTQVIRTGYGNEYKPLMVNVDSIAGITEDREGYGEVRLTDGYVYITRECALDIQHKIEVVQK
jgi:hypothetical protein